MEIKIDKTEILQTIDLSYLLGKCHFEDAGTHNYLVFQPVYKYFETPANIDKAIPWKSKVFSEESIKPLATLDDSLVSGLYYIDNAKIRVKFYGNYLKKEKITISHNNILILYIVMK